ncbi:MAG TPA: hypothetical protein DDZ53_05745 [Firmicutes bacterium]|nr:hypothetical protein [Bacillota bacterium]
MVSMTREEILKRINIEDARIKSADQNIAGLVLQRGDSLDKQSRLFALLEALPEEEPTAPAQ